jgi:Fe-S-cluster containining protein
MSLKLSCILWIAEIREGKKLENKGGQGCEVCVWKRLSSPHLPPTKIRRYYLKFTVKCGSCHACCTRLHKVKKMLNFPYRIINGVCEKLVAGKCSIYDNRPEVCNVTEMRKYFDGTNKEYIELVRRSCREIRGENV